MITKLPIQYDIMIDSDHYIRCDGKHPPYWLLGEFPSDRPGLTKREIALVKWGLKKHES